MSNADKNKSSENDIESPVDGPTPDWMKMATSSDKPSLTDENTPGWLKDIRSGKSDSVSEVLTDSNDEAASEMSDLERLLAEEGIDLGAVAEDRPQGSEGMSARDWMISTSDDELIRRRIGATEETLDESVAAATSAVSPTEANATPDPASEMSDLERLLAEEGVDLGAVAEERPEGSEGMSARDWMISTSDDELIRRRIGADETDLSAAEAQPAPTPTEARPEPVVEPEPVAPAPAPSSAADSVVEDDKMVVEEDLPDWLREIDEEDDVAAPLPMADNQDDKMVDEDGLPDWLQDTDESKEPELTTDSFAESSPEATVDNAEDLPDWLGGFQEEPESPQSINSSIGLNDEDDDKMVVAEDLPDWLREGDEETDEIGEVDIATAIEDDGIVVEDDLPDWLSDAAEADNTLPSSAIDSPPKDETDADLTEDDLPDWLSASDDLEEATFDLDASESVSSLDGTTDDEDLPDWLREVQADSPEIEPTTDSVAPVEAEDDELDFDEDLPDWLREVKEDATAAKDAQPVAASSSTDTASVGLDDDNLPDWLREDDDDTFDETDAPPDDVPVTATVHADEDDLPDWLREVSDDDDGEEPDFSADDDDTFIVEEDDLPDWLNEIEVENDDPFEPSEPSPEEAAETEAADDLPDWLRETEDDDGVDMVEETTESLPTAEPIETESPANQDNQKDLPDWLQEEPEAEEVPEVSEVPSPQPEPEPLDVQVSCNETSIAQDEAEAAEELTLEPMPVAQVEPPSLSERIRGQMPDWLKKLREGGPYEASEASGVVSTATTPPSSQTARAIGTPAKFDQSLGQNLPQDSAKRLEIAREARERGEIDEAIPIYSNLVSHGAHLTNVIDDLQQSIKVYPTNYLLYQVMGDAMMKDGRLQNALEAYRQALTKLTG